MGLYLRKSLSVGPFRFNLSTAGLGVSVGVPGFRLGTSPRGNYIHVGRAGIYYRATLPGSSQQVRLPRRPLKELPLTDLSMQEIESAETSTIVDIDSADLVSEMCDKRRKMRVWPWVLSFSAGSLAATAHLLPKLPTAIFLIFSVFALVATLGALLFDQIRKTTVLMYDFESGSEKPFENLQAAFGAAASCSARWHISARGNVRDRKYYAGASAVVHRKPVSVLNRSPPFIKTNVLVPSIPAGKQTLYFFPDCLIVIEATAVGAVSYSNLSVESRSTQFVEEGTVPRDARVVDRTWRYVNKSGGPDRRFKDNRQLPVALYDEIQFSSDTGLNEVFQLSRTNISNQLIAAIQGLNTHYGRSPIARSRHPI